MLTEADVDRRAQEIRAHFAVDAFGAGMPLEQILQIAETVQTDELRIYNPQLERYTKQRGTWDVVWRHPRADEGYMSLVQYSVPDAAEVIFQRTMPTNYRTLRETFVRVRAAAMDSGRTIFDETALHPDTIYCLEQEARLMIVPSAGRALHELYVLYLLLSENRIIDVSGKSADEILTLFAGNARAD